MVAEPVAFRVELARADGNAQMVESKHGVGERRKGRRAASAHECLNLPRAVYHCTARSGRVHRLPH